jgi:hypothetical protein
LPLRILLIGAVLKNTHLYWRPVADCRYTNRFVDLCLACEVPLDGYAVASVQLELPLLRGRCPGSLRDDTARWHRRSMSSGKVAKQGGLTDCSKLFADKTHGAAGCVPGRKHQQQSLLVHSPGEEVCGIAKWRRSAGSPSRRLCSARKSGGSSATTPPAFSGFGHLSFISIFNYFIGGPMNNHVWDRLKAITEEMRNTASFLLKHMGTLVRLGEPIWSPRLPQSTIDSLSRCYQIHCRA